MHVLLIPLPLSLCLSHDDVQVRVDLTLDPASLSVFISAEARCTGPTGVEMEALTAASVAALTVYDMCKVREGRVCVSVHMCMYVWL